ncbi:flagellar hook-associated protein FlgK [Vreelandella arcis]|uniref:Flagellar hook-associated protein 1 n=1 Tax=Vreelandella arcis TaxID=416873 RepID=A0A1H0AXT0_9GAMM|nr:flagellar hook-associated protein FlgK [Halomonas arcis]SDN38199.1 flagellar hook-associated protein 1 FlgK [Halomonas arcis]
MSMFSIGLSGLNAAQNALNTTSNNISNVYTPGYNREITKLGEGSAGTGGVQVNDIERQFNQYVAEQLNSAKTQSSALETYYNQVSQIDNLLADREAGLSPLMQNFFSSMEDLASSPSDPAARQGVLGNVETLSAQFRSFDSYLQDMQTNINNQLEDEVTQINNTTEQIAGLNKELALARARTGEAPNSLLNQRDKLVSDLNERMDLRLNIQDGKTYNISLPNGQPLVTGTDSYKLETMEADYDPQRTVIGYRDGGGNLTQLDEDTVSGGSLGGLMSFRDETLDKTQNQIGQLAISLSMAVNEQHKQGVDLNGDQGENLFKIRSPQTYGYENNSDATITSAEFDVSRVDELRATDYTVSFDDNDEPVVTRNDNGQVVAFDQDAWNNDDQLKFGGVTLEFSDGADAPVEGDQFEIQPVRRAGAGMEANISDLDKIAAGDAGFINVGNDTGNSFEREGDLNVSDLGITSNAFDDNRKYQFEVESNAAGDEGTLTVTPATDIVVNNSNVDASDISDIELKEGDEIEVDGISFTVSLPDADETSSLTVSQTIFATGDNRNALAMQNLQSESIVGGSATLSGAYGSMVSDVGNRTNITEVNLDARQGLTDQLTAVQQSESGVNLDEEAANLIRYQQFYQANARVIDTAGTIMDTILNLRG